MKSIDSLKKRLDDLYKEKRLTDRELASIAGLSQGHINALRHGKREIGGIAIRTCVTLFPDLDEVIDYANNAALRGEKLKIGNVNAGIINHSNVNSPAASVSDDGLRQRIQVAILQLNDVDPVTILKVLKTVMEIR